MRRELFAVVVTAVVLSAAAFAQTTVKADQGRPGNQGPWPVTCVSSTCSATIVVDGGLTINASFTFDGGYTGAVAPQPCNTLLSTNTSVGASAVPVPSVPLANRIWVDVTNSILNPSSAQCICAANTCPTFVATSVGDVLATGDTAHYALTGADAGVPCCICNGAATRITGLECSL